jgi:hypothetical protein
VDIVIGLAGVVLLALVLWDIFETIVVPRPTPSRIRLSRPLVRIAWRGWRAIGLRFKTGLALDGFLGFFAPGAAVLLLAMWLLVLILGYGLILFALRGELQPATATFGETLYYAGTSVLTLGYGDFVATGTLSRIASITAGASGLALVALVITFLFSLFGSYQRREVLIVRLAARAKSPPSAATLLETYARLEIVDQLPALFAEWEAWTAEVLDTHVAYPLLAFFRSSHDNVSWISALGAVLDTAALVLTTIKGVPRAQAEITKRVGAHLVEDMTNNFGLTGDGSSVARDEFQHVYRRLERAGYELEPEEDAWRRFERGRGSYAGRLEALATYWATPATLWDGPKRVGESAVHASTVDEHQAAAAMRRQGVGVPDEALTPISRARAGE